MKSRLYGVFAAVSYFVTAAFAGCAVPSQTVAADVDMKSWDYAAAVVVCNNDTVTMHDVTLFLRCNERLREDTVTLRVLTTAPDSLRCEELVHMILYHKHEPASLTAEYTTPYRRQIRLPLIGKYRFSIAPVRSLCGVEAVGIQLTNSK